MPPRKKVDAAAVIERKTQALDFRKAGYTYRQIGERLGVTHVQAFRDVQDGLKELAGLRLDSAEDLRQIELERLDKAIKGLMPFVEAGSANHAVSLVRVIGERAKLLGLYAPEKHEIIDWQERAIADIRAGKLTYAQLASAFDTSLAASLFARAGVLVSATEDPDE